MPDKPLLLPTPEKQAAQQQQLQFPMTRYTVNEEGLIIQTFLTATDISAKVIPASDMNQIMAEWKRIQRDAKAQLETIAAVRRSRND